MKPRDSEPVSSTKSARQPGKTGADAIGESPDQSPVLVAESTPEALRSDPDEVLKLAIKAAVDAGDTARAMALLEVLRAPHDGAHMSGTRAAPVVSLEARRSKR